jgi:hypothetical protein
MVYFSLVKIPVAPSPVHRPAAERLRPSGGRSVSPVQRVKVSLGFKEVTVLKSMSVEEIVRVLGYTEGRGMFAGTFMEEPDEADARLLVAELKGHAKANERPLSSLIEDLNNLVSDESDGEGSQADGKDGSGTDEEDGSDAEEEAARKKKAAAKNTEAARLKKKGFGDNDIEKIQVAQEVQGVFQQWGKPVYLSGGGAIALFAQQREINDLDFRINASSLGGRSSWYDPPAGPKQPWTPGAELVELNKRTNEEFENVPSGSRPSATNTRTAGVESYDGTGVEVSVTIVGEARATEKDEATGVDRLTKGELLSDKLKTIISRNKIGDDYIEKVAQDVYDALAVYISKYNTNKVDSAVLKGHLSERTKEYRIANTEEDPSWLKEVDTRELVNRMFNRLIITANVLMNPEVDDDRTLQGLANKKATTAAALASLAQTQLQPIWDGWFEVVGERGKLKNKPIFVTEAFNREIVRQVRGMILNE